MSSLSAHLREPEDHSRLPFHPACPVCRRDRLAGSLDGEELVGRRTQAAIAAGLLAFSSAVGPASAIAQEPDQFSEGTAETVDPGDTSLSVDLELEGEELELTDEVPVTPDASSPPATGDDDGPLEQDLAMEIQGTVVDTTADPASEEPAEVVPEEPAPAPEPAPAAPVETPAPTSAPVAEAVEPEGDGGMVAVAPERRERRKTVERDRREPAAAPAPAPATAVVEPVPAAEPAAAPAPVETVRVVARSTGSRADSGDRFHVVRPGESLWSIASDLLGERATVPRIAREVNRLWELNDDRIGTGRRDLLYAGTRLRLR